MCNSWANKDLRYVREGLKSGQFIQIFKMDKKIENRKLNLF
jgi:hypothetical protein